MKMLIVNFEPKCVYNSADLTKRNTWNLIDRFSIVRSFMGGRENSVCIQELKRPLNSLSARTTGDLFG